jgi:hypothetical protein
MASALGSSKVVVLQDSTGKPLQCREVNGCWVLQTADKPTDDALQDPTFWMQMEATREYIAIKSVTGVTNNFDGHFYVQFSPNSPKMIFVIKATSGLREQLQVLQVQTCEPCRLEQFPFLDVEQL